VKHKHRYANTGTTNQHRTNLKDVDAIMQNNNDMSHDKNVVSHMCLTQHNYTGQSAQLCQEAFLLHT